MPADAVEMRVIHQPRPQYQRDIAVEERRQKPVAQVRLDVIPWAGVGFARRPGEPALAVVGID